MIDNRRSQLSIVYGLISCLQPHPNNARTHSKKQLKLIAKSIQEFGFLNPVLIDRKGNIIAGHGRVEAAKLLSLDQVPTICLEDLTDDQIRAYILADNKLAELAGWDQEILATELEYLYTLEDTLDIAVTGFEVAEIDLILEEGKRTPDPDDDCSAEEEGPSVSEPGDLWRMGKHKVQCGDALSDDSYSILMGKQRVSAVFTDPPYNVRIKGHAGGNGAIQHREFAMASGEMTELEFLSFLSRVLGFSCRYSVDGSVHYICMDWRHLYQVLAAGRDVYDSLLNLCVWSKDAAGMGSFYRSQHELVFVFRNGKSQHRNNVQLGKFGRNRSNIWQYPGIQTQSRQSDEGNLLALHPTVKPTALVADALLDCTARGEIVLDAFLGSGTTLMAAERVGRVCYGIEIDPLYVDTAIRRWQRYTGECAVHAATGETFDLRAARQEEVTHGR
jgi:DNA modification methylase